MSVTSSVRLLENSPQADPALLSDAELSVAADGLDGAQDSPAGTLAALGLEAAEWIATLCGVSGIDGNPPTLKPEDLVETFRIRGTEPRSLILARRFVSDVTVVENGSTLTEDTDFVVIGDAGIVRRLSGDAVICWPCGTIVVTYTAGLATIPPVLKAVAQDYVRMRLSTTDRDPLERSVQVEGLDTVSYREAAQGESGFVDMARERLARFIRPSFP